MTSKQKSLSVTAKGTATAPTLEHVLNALKAGLSTAPFCGGLASLMTDYIPSAKQKRLEKFTKQIAFRGVLVNSAIGFNASQEEREYFVNLINSLSGLHLRILKFMAVPLEYLRDMEISSDRIRGGFSRFFPVAIPEVNIEVIKSAFGDPYKYGFIGTDKSIFETMTSGQGLSLLGGRVTQLGTRFIEFCMIRKVE
jgi:hypothetical protein